MADHKSFPLLIIKLVIVIIRGKLFLSFLHVTNCLGSWVHDIPPYWWDKAKEENNEVVEHMARSIVKFPENLIWSESMSVMVSMSL